jgi:hypothetical protein
MSGMCAEIQLLSLAQRLQQSFIHDHAMIDDVTPTPQMVYICFSAAVGTFNDFIWTRHASGVLNATWG